MIIKTLMVLLHAERETMSHAANDDEAHIYIIKSGISPVTCSLSSHNIIITINIVFSADGKFVTNIRKTNGYVNP